MPQWKAKVDGESYSVDLNKLTLGELCTLNEDYDMADLTVFEATNPKHLLGIFAIAVRRQHPDWTDDEVRKKAEGIENGPVYEKWTKELEAEMEKAENPPKAAATNGGQAKTRSKPGVPS